MYFLVISILTTMPFSPKPPASMLGTFGFVLLLSMIKDAVEDYSRYKSDVKANNEACTLYDYSSHEFVSSKWKDVRIGDLVRIKKDE